MCVPSLALLVVKQGTAQDLPRYVLMKHIRCYMSVVSTVYLLIGIEKKILMSRFLDLGD